MNYMDVPIGKVVPFIFDTFAGSTGASITLTGLVVGDVRIIKDATVTPKANPTAGIALIDTDGIDIGGGAPMTGIHGFTIDTGNTTDAGYFAVGSYYNVVVDSVTIDSQTVRFLVGAFRLMAAEAQAGYPKTDSQYVTGAAPETGTVIAVAVRTEMDSNSSDLNTIITSQATIAGYLDTEIAAIKAKTDNLPASPAAAGGAMTLTSGERDAVADALLDRANGIETGLTPRQQMKIVAAAAAGVVSGAGTSSIAIKPAGLPAGTTRIQTTGSDVSGNRPTVTLDFA